jgi:molecular chaperone IbpA
MKKDVNMRTIDLSPLYRSVVGFDRLAALMEAASKAEASSGYPPYNIETTGDDAYRIEVAVAGFRPDELSVDVKENVLTVAGRKAANTEDGRRYLHRGLAERNFERRFQLADYVVVTDADLADGLLSISLKRELPESMKPRRIEIGTGRAPASAPQADAGLIEGHAQAA